MLLLALRSAFRPQAGLSAEPTVSDSCPQCRSPGKAVTAVTIAVHDHGVDKVLVTRSCTLDRCQLKYPVFKTADRLTAEERSVWRKR